MMIKYIHSHLSRSIFIDKAKQSIDSYAYGTKNQTQIKILSFTYLIVSTLFQTLYSQLSWEVKT